jgi:hypothetical protein
LGKYKFILAGKIGRQDLLVTIEYHKLATFARREYRGRNLQMRRCRCFAQSSHDAIISKRTDSVGIGAEMNSGLERFKNAFTSILNRVKILAKILRFRHFLIFRRFFFQLI